MALPHGCSHLVLLENLDSGILVLAVVLVGSDANLVIHPDVSLIN